MIPHFAGRPARKASSPKSLSNVSSNRFCVCATRFRAKDFARVAEAGLNVFVRESGIVFEDLSFRPTLGQKINDEFDSESGSFNNRLADQNIGIENNAFLPLHF